MPRLFSLFGLICILAGALMPANDAHAQSTASERCENPGIVMMATSWCSHCRRARNFFRENNIDFDEIDVEQSESASVRATAKKFGIPYIIVGGEEIRGFNERRLRDLLCLPG